MTATTQDAATADAKGAGRKRRSRSPSVKSFMPAETASATTEQLESHALATLSTALPEHSPLGASSSERWMNCPGSVALSKVVTGLGEGEEPEWTREGNEAHALGAHCLTEDVDAWEVLGDYEPEPPEDMVDAVQVYLNFVRSLPSRETHVEVRLHRPEFHPQAYGTSDFVAVSVLEDALDFVDYKHGVGVPVEVENNTQLMYYAYLFIHEDRENYPDEAMVRLHICQPRAFHAAGPIRSWSTTAGEIRRWAREELRPAMERVTQENYLSMGEWCRFCPAKLVCPAMACLSDELQHKLEKHDPAKRLQLLDPEALGDWYAKAQRVRMYVKAIEEETARRVLGGIVVPGVKAVQKRSDRAWKENAPLEEKFGKDAWERKLKSPPQIEKLPGGKAFVAEYAFKPNTGLTIALVGDSRPAVSVQTDEEKYKKFLTGPA